MSTVKVVGGAKLNAKLAQILEGANKTMRAGVLEGSTYPNGLPTALVAFWNEYGATIHHPGGTKYITDAIVKGKYVGTRFVGNDFSGEHKTTEAHDIVIPARPALRITSTEKATRWTKVLAAGLKANGFDIDGALRLAGEAAMTDIKRTIGTFTDPPNAASTIRKKGFDQPLRNTKNYLNSVSYDVVDGPVDEN